MKESLEQALQMFLNALTTASDFVIEQAPLILQELLLLETITRSIWVGFGLILFILSLWRSIYMWSHWHWFESKTREDERITSFIILFFSYIVGIVMFFVNIIPLIKILIAPRVYLIEYINDLIK